MRRKRGPKQKPLEPTVIEQRIAAMDPNTRRFYADLVRSIEREFKTDLNPGPDQERQRLQSSNLGFLN